MPAWSNRFTRRLRRVIQQRAPGGEQRREADVVGELGPDTDPTRVCGDGQLLRLCGVLLAGAALSFARSDWTKARTPGAIEHNRHYRAPMRTFPFSPRSAADLDLGDYWVVALPSGDLGVLQVRDLQKTGPGARTAFVAGVVEWRGDHAPSPGELEGRRVLAQGLTRIEVFTEGGAQVVGNAAGTVPVAGLTSGFRDFAVGTVTQTWGWRALAKRVDAVLSAV